MEYKWIGCKIKNILNYQNNFYKIYYSESIIKNCKNCITYIIILEYIIS
jgi:hypothetical protein